MSAWLRHIRQYQTNCRRIVIVTCNTNCQAASSERHWIPWKESSAAYTNQQIRKKQTHVCPILYYERVTNNTQTNLKNTTNINVTHYYGMNKAYN